MVSHSVETTTKMNGVETESFTKHSSFSILPCYGRSGNVVLNSKQNLKVEVEIGILNVFSC